MPDRARNLALISECAAKMASTLPPLPDRPVITDDGHEIHLTIYRNRTTVSQIALTPQHALTLARRLIDGAAARFRHKEDNDA